MTLRSPIFRKLLLAALLLILVTAAALDFSLTRFVSAREAGAVERQLESQSRILSGELGTVSADRIEDWAKSAGARAQSRVTLIGPDGRVVADSEHDPTTMENHSERPEVREAMAGHRGVSIRHSSTMDLDFVYVASPAMYEGQKGFVLRLAVPLRHLRAAISEVRWRAVRISLVAVALALALGYFFSRMFTRRIHKLQRFAEGLVEARFTDRLEPAPEDELGSLARALNKMAGQMQDLVARLSSESARREAILSSMVEGVLAVDQELCVTFCNESFAGAVGAQMPVPERLPVLELVRDPEFLDLLTRVLVTGATQKRRLQLSAAGDRTYEIQAAPLEVRSRRGAIAILHDVTDLERLERVRKDFVANVSHELRTPLAAIQGYTETLLDGAIDDRENSRRFLEVIKTHTVRLGRITSDLLALSELESGKSIPPPERVSIRAAVESALSSVEPEARLRQIKVHAVNLPDDFIMGNRVRVEEALVNLLDNAAKFNRPGGEVWVEAGRTPDGKVQVTVIDDGIGIPSEDLPRIFERFYRVDKARSREVGGTGLGLAIVKHIVERMGGSVNVESQLGKGSRFTLVFPPA
ncbi:MAG: ATP-binding protein [Bryobacteraceae bacterium]